MESELGRDGFAVVFGPCGWEAVGCSVTEELPYSNQSGWFSDEAEARAHAAQLNG